MDNILSVVKRNKGHSLLEHLNAQHEKIRFTMEEEKMGRYHSQTSVSPGMNTGRSSERDNIVN